MHLDSRRLLVIVFIIGATAVGTKIFMSRDIAEMDQETPPQIEGDLEDVGEIGKESEESHEPVEENQVPEESIRVRVENITLSSESVYAGVPVEAVVLIRNLDESTGLYMLRLTVGGELEEAMEVSLAGGDVKEVNITVTRTRQGRYTVQAGNASAVFEVIHMGLIITNFNVTPVEVAPGENVTISVTTENLNAVENEETFLFYIRDKTVERTVTVDPLGIRVTSFNVSMEEPSSYHVMVRNHSSVFMVVLEEESNDTHQTEPPQPVQHTPMYYVGDPLTDNFTCLLPPEASPLRLSLTASVNNIFFERDSGLCGFGLHAGGHPEGLDHVWIEIREGVPVRSWANGTVTDVRISGDVEHSEYHITIDYGQNLIGTHMEIETPLVEVGDYVERGQPVGYGMSYFSGMDSAEFGLVDLGRRDGVRAWGGGAAVSPYDYLEESEKLALVEAYKEHTVERYMKGLRTTWFFKPYQPYLTNRLLIHDFYPDKLTGEWYLNGSEWGRGYPDDTLTLIEAENPYYTGNVIIGTDKTEGGENPYTLDGTFYVDYENGRIQIRDGDGTRYYGIFEVDESGDVATLKLEYHQDGYPDEFSPDAPVYVERTVD